MMHFIVQRLDLEDDFTHSELWQEASNNNRHIRFAHVIEDTVRDINADGDLDDEGEGKVYGKTAIPYGVYYGQVRESPKRKKLFEQGKLKDRARIELPYIDNVKHFKSIQMHSGTDQDDSLGCLIVGYTWKSGIPNKVSNSRACEKDIVFMIKQHDPVNKKFKITIK